MNLMKKILKNISKKNLLKILIWHQFMEHVHMMSQII